MTNAANISRTNNAIKECLLKAKEMFGFDEYVDVEFRNTGRTAGLAEYRYGTYKLVFNSQLLADDKVGELIADTVPHEIAHLVCYYRPTLGRNHDRGWQRVCLMLGGNGSRTHSMEVKKARRTRKALYNINSQTIEVGVAMHKKIQAGASYHLKSSKTPIKPQDFTGKVIMK